MKRSKQVRDARRKFPGIIAGHARKVAAAMVRKGMLTANYVFEGAMGDGLVLITLDPKVTEAIRVVLAALEAESLKPEEVADLVQPERGERVPLPPGGVNALAMGAKLPARLEDPE